ncbi:uncharacterized protein [Antedon mediterranea]|uniref:uncharacterized protein n=1 Tax=Antedon mediterranea TaxID=105859 RepID=UPI003AF83598
MEQDDKNTDDTHVVNFEIKRSKILKYMAYTPPETPEYDQEEISSAEESIFPLSIKPSDLIMNKSFGFVSSASSRVKIGINSRQSSRVPSCCPSQHDMACESNISFCSANTAPLPYRKDMFWDMGMLVNRMSSTALLNEWVSKTTQRRRLAESFRRDLPRLTRLISNSKVSLTEIVDGKPEVIHSSTALARLDEICPVEDEQISVDNEGFFTPPCTSMTFIAADEGQTLTPDIFNALRNQVIILDGMVRSNDRPTYLPIEAPATNAEHNMVPSIQLPTNETGFVTHNEYFVEDIGNDESPKDDAQITACRDNDTGAEEDNQNVLSASASTESVIMNKRAQQIVEGVLKSAITIVNAEAAAETQILTERAQQIVQGVIESALQVVKDTHAQEQNDVINDEKPEGTIADESKINRPVSKKVKPAVAPKPAKKFKTKIGIHEHCERKVAAGDVAYHPRHYHNNVQDVQTALIEDIPIQRGSTKYKIQHFEHMRNLVEGHQEKQSIPTVINNNNESGELSFIDNNNESGELSVIYNNESGELSVIDNNNESGELTVIDKNNEIEELTTVIDSNNEREQLTTTVIESNNESEQLITTVIDINNESEQLTTTIDDSNNESEKLTTTVIDSNNESEQLKTIVIYSNNESEQLKTTVIDINNESEQLKTTVIYSINESEQLKTTVIDSNNESEQLKTTVIYSNNESEQLTSIIDNNKSTYPRRHHNSSEWSYLEHADINGNTMMRGDINLLSIDNDVTTGMDNLIPADVERHHDISLNPEGKPEDIFYEIDIHNEGSTEVNTEEEKHDNVEDTVVPNAPSAGIFHRFLRRIRKRLRKRRRQTPPGGDADQTNNDVLKDDNDDTHNTDIATTRSATTPLEDLGDDATENKNEDEVVNDRDDSAVSASSSEIDMLDVNTRYKFLVGCLCYKH